MSRRLAIGAACLGICVWGGATAHGAIAGPYSVDSSTVHLWHLDEAAGASSAANAVGGKFSLLSLSLSNAASPAVNTTILGATGSTGFGNAGNISATALALAYDGTNNGSYSADVNGTTLGSDGVSTSSLVGANGSLTLEALVRLPSLTSGVSQEIIAMDNSTSSNRSFQFVIRTGGVLHFAATSPFAGGPSLSATIPTTGPDAFVANTWFHTAFTYDGDGNAKLYWTLLDPSRTEAALLASGTGLSDLAANSAPLVIGNENRANSGEALVGLIDEVRISSVARAPGEFVFVPEPGSAVTLLGACLLFGCRRRRRAR